MLSIEHLLSREIGLSAASIGATAIELAAKSRMKEIGIRDLERYVALLQHDSKELRALIEQIVVSETWFFRDPDVFRTLVEHVNGVWRKKRTGRALRVLTIPCATGEEAYSIAITLLDAGLSPDNYRIQAFDVSELAVAAARRGSYGKNAFRGDPLGDKRRYFEVLGSGELCVGEAARASLSIENGNLLDGALVPPHTQFDVIFCRNVLIYLDRPARTRAFDHLLRWLAPDGLLFAGHAEALDRMDERFQRQPNSHFGYVRRQSSEALESGGGPVVRARPRESFAASGKPPTDGKHVRSPALARNAEPRTVPTQNISEPKAPDNLAQIAKLADRGELSTAARECERYIASAGASTEAYCLLGVVRKAAGDTEAALDCFTKALYLDQRHYESLVHLALLHEQRGDRASAANFRRRADRVRGSTEK